MTGYGWAWFLTSCSIAVHGLPSDDCLEWLAWVYASQRIEGQA